MRDAKRPRLSLQRAQHPAESPPAAARKAALPTQVSFCWCVSPLAGSRWRQCRKAQILVLTPQQAARSKPAFSKACHLWQSSPVQRPLNLSSLHAVWQGPDLGFGNRVQTARHRTTL